MGIILSRPTQPIRVKFLHPSSLSTVRPYHKKHYKDTVGTISLDVQLDKPAVGGESVAFSHTGGTVGVDYTVGTVSPLIFLAGETARTIEVSVVDKAQYFEYVEIVTSFGALTGVVADGWANEVMTVIEPSTEPPQVVFVTAADTVSVGGGFSIAAMLDTASAAVVTLHYELGGTVSLAEVTIPDTGTITIAAGNTAASITGSFSGSVSAGETLTVTLTHEDGTVVPELALRMWPSENEWQPHHSEENVASFSDPTDFEMPENFVVAQAPVFPGTESNWGPGGTTNAGPPGTHTALFVDQVDPSPLMNPFTGLAHKVYAYTPNISVGTPYLRESFADSYCDGHVTAGNPPSAEAYTSKVTSGVNLDEMAGTSAERTFLNVMKNGRQWLEDTTGSTGFGATLTTTQDAQGYPVPVASTDYISLVNWDGGLNSLDAGDYEVSWDGDGDIIFEHSGSPQYAVTARTNVTANSCTITVASVATGGIYVRVTGSNPADPVTNISVMRPGYTKDTLEVFTLEFKSAIRRFSGLRMMDWQKINFSPIVNFSDFTPVDNFSYQVDTGVPLAIQIRAAAEAQADIWMCIPHLSTDACVTEWAQFVRESLPPQCRVRVEYSNEVWNSTFGDFPFVLGQSAGQYDHCLTEADNLGLGDSSDSGQTNGMISEFNGRRALEVWNLCDAEWRGAGYPVRRSRVLGGFIATTFNATTGLDETGVEAKCDLVAVAPYVGRSTANLAAFETDSDAVTEGLLDADLAAMFAASGEVDDTITSLVGRTNDEGRDIKLCFYEAGQDLTPTMNAFGGTWIDDDVVRLKAIRINQSAYMGTFYTAFQAHVQTLLDSGDLDSSFLYEMTSKYGDSVSTYVGQFGLAEYTGQADSEKLNAVLATAADADYQNPPAYGSLARYNRISHYIEIPQGEDVWRAEHVKFAQISLRNRTKSVNHTVTFRLDFPSLVGQVDNLGASVTPIATSIGNVGFWEQENSSGVTPMELGIEEDAYGVRLWMIHHADSTTLYSGSYANVGDYDDDGSTNASDAFVEIPYRDSGNAIFRPGWTDTTSRAAAGGIQEFVGHGLIIYGVYHERSDSALTGAPGLYRPRPRHSYEPQGLAVLVPSDTNTHTLTVV
jgi:hypothetical protein